MRKKLAFLLLACAALSNCSLVSKDDSGWTYDLPEENADGTAAGTQLNNSFDSSLEDELEINGFEAVQPESSAQPESSVEGDLEDKSSDKVDLPQRGPRPAPPSLVQLDEHSQVWGGVNFGHLSRAYHDSAYSKLNALLL